MSPVNPTISFQEYLAYTNPNKTIVKDPVRIQGPSSKYDEGFILPERNPEFALNEYRAASQPWQDKLANGLTNMTSSAFTGALESSIGLVYGGISAIVSQDASKFYNNEFGRTMDAINESARENFPFYYSEAEKNASVLGGMGYQNFWFDKVLGGAGYTIGSLAVGMGAARVFNMGKNARLAKLTDDLSAAEAAGQLSTEALKYSRWDMAKQIALGTVMAHGESSMEARQTYDSAIDFYTEAREKGIDGNPMFADYADLSDEKIQKLAADASSSNYILNMAITGPTDLILLGKWVNPGKAASIRTYNEIGKRQAVGGTTEYFDKVAAQKSAALLNVGSKFLKGFTVEGIQEGSQFASNIAAQEFVKLHSIEGKSWLDALTRGITEGLAETLTSKEGLESILVGGLVGGPFGLRGSTTEFNAKTARTKQLVDLLNNDPNFLEANPKVRSFIAALNATNRSEGHLQNGDLFKAKNEADLGLNQYLKSIIDSGASDYFIEKMNSMKEMEQEELDKHFGPNTTPQQIDQVIERLTNLQKLNDSINTLYGTPGGTPEQKAYNEKLRELLFFSASTIKDVEGRMDSVTKQLRDLNNPDVNNILAARQNIINMHKTIIPEDVPKELKLEEYVEQMRDKAIEQFNETVKQFAATNPVDAAGIMPLIGDLNKLDERKQEFIDYYNQLNNPDSANKRLEEVQSLLAEMTKEAQKESNNNAEVDAINKLNLDTLDKLIKPKLDREDIISYGGENIDITKQETTLLDEMREDLRASANESLEEGNAEQYDALSALADKIDAEVEFRQKVQDTINNAKDSLLKATTPEEVDSLVKALEDSGYFEVNSTEVAQIKHNVSRKAKVDQDKQEVQNTIDSMFHGTDEFFNSFVDANTQMKENLVQALGRPDANKKIYFKIKRNPNPGNISNIGKDGKVNPRLKKISPPFIVEVWSGATEGFTDLHIGYLPWYGQYTDKNGVPLNISDLTGTGDLAKNKAKYNELFGPDSSNPEKHSYEAFVEANKKMELLYRELNSLLGDKVEVTLSLGKTAQLANIEITKGNYNFVIEETPLADFQLPDTVNPPLVLNGSPVIVSTSSYDGTSSDFYNKTKAITTDTAIASVRDNTNNTVLTDPKSITGGTRAEFIPALEKLKQILSDPSSGNAIWNKYWMLVQDPSGSIEIEGMPGKYDWRPVTPRILNTEEREAVFAKVMQLAEQGKALDPDVPEDRLTFGNIVKEINKDIFIAIGSNTEFKQIKNVRVGFVPKKSGLTVELDLEFAIPRASKDGPVYRGKVSLKVPDTITSFTEFVTWFNKEITKGANVQYVTKDKNRDFVPMEPLSNMISPISDSSLRLNFVGDDSKGLATLTPDNVWDSFSVGVNRILPRKNQRLRVVPTAKAAVHTPNPIQPPVNTATGNTTTSNLVPPPPILPAGVMMEEEADPITAAFGPPVTITPRTSTTPATQTPVNKFDLSSAKYYSIPNDKGEFQSEVSIDDALFAIDKNGNVTVINADKLQRAINRSDSYLRRAFNFENSPDSSIHKGIIIKSYPKVVGNKITEKGSLEFTTEFKGIVEAIQAPAAPADKKADIERRRDEKIAELDKSQGYKSQSDQIERIQIQEEYLADVAALETKQKLTAPTQAPVSAAAAPATLAPPVRKRLTAEEVKQKTGKDPKTRSTGYLTEGEKIDMENAISTLQSMLPSWITVEEMSAAIENWRNGRITFGSFYNNIIKLSRLAPKGTELHEAFHAVFRTLLSDAEQDALYKEAKDMMIKELKAKNMSFVQGFENFKKERLDYTSIPGITQEQLKNLYIEEWMADDFAKQSKKPAKKETPKTFIGKLLQKFYNLIKKITDFFKGNKRLKQLYSSIEDGKFKTAQAPVKNRFSANPEINIEARSEINVGFSLGRDGEYHARFLDSSYQLKFVNTIASNVLSSLQSGDTNLTAIDLIEEELQRFKEIFDRTKYPEIDFDNPDPSIIDKIDLFMDFEYLFSDTSEDAETSRLLFKDEILTTLNQFNVNEFDASPDEDYDGNDNITERSFDLNNENKGGFTSLSKVLRKYISTTAYSTTFDEFFGLEPGTLFGQRQITVTVDPKLVYNGIVKLVANQASPIDILRKMDYYRREAGESARFLNKFFEDAGISFNDQTGELSYNPDKIVLIERVVKGFNLYEVDYLFTEIDRGISGARKPDSKTYLSNRKNVDYAQVQSWSSKYADLRNRVGAEGMKDRANQFKGLAGITANIELDNNQLEELTDIIKTSFASLGISVSKMYLKYMILANPSRPKNAEQLRFVDTFADNVKLTNAEFAESIKLIVTNLMGQGTNPFEKGTMVTAEEGAVTRLMKIAKDNAVFDETITFTTMINADGKNIYPYQKANYHIQKIFELQNLDLNDPTVLASIQSEKVNQDFLANNRLLDNDVFRALLPTLKVERLDGLRQTKLEEKNGEKKNVGTDNTEGVTYGSMSERELTLTMYSLFADNSTDFNMVTTTKEGKRIKEKQAVRRTLFLIMEASNTADVLKLPVQAYIQNNRINNAFKEAFFAEIKREYDRIQRVNNNEYPDQYNKFNAFTSEEKQRGRKFWETASFLEAAGVKNDLEQGIVSLEEVRDTLLDAMDDFFIKELNDHFEGLKVMGILSPSGENRLLNKKYEGFGVEGDPIFSKVSLKENIFNAYLNNYLNNISINQVFMGDPALTLDNNVAWYKRAKGNNASGDNYLRIDQNQNTPLQVVTFGRLDSKGELADFVNTEYKLATRIYKIGSKEYNDYVASLSEEERDTFLKASPEEIAIADAQAYTTVKGMLNFLGTKITPRGKEIYEKVANNQSITKEDWEYLAASGQMMNSQKLVYYDGVTYIKMSVAVLSPEYTTDKNGNPRPGMEMLHNMRLSMEENNIDMMGSPSMMKKMIKNPLVLSEESPEVTIEGQNIQKLDRGYLRLQQENPSNKTVIKDPTQQISILPAEQGDVPINFVWDSSIKTAKQLASRYDQLLAERIKTTFHAAKKFMLKLQNGEPVINMKRAVQAFKKSLEETGASAQILSYLEVDEAGELIHNLNAPNIVRQFEQHFNSFFNKVLSQKVPGYKTTLQSGFNHRILEDKNTGKIIRTDEYDSNPDKYKDRSRYIPRKLAFDQPRIIDGKEVHRYSEVVIPYHFAEQFNLKTGDEIPVELAYLFGTRIPSQDKHSAMVLKIVDVLPPYYGSNMIAPDELILLTGSDFDIDSFFIHRFDHYYKDGEFRVYGNKKDSKWEQFKIWHKENAGKTFVQDIMNELEKELLQSQGGKEGDSFSKIVKTALQKVKEAERADALVSELGMAGEGYEALSETDKQLVSDLPKRRKEYNKAREIVKSLRESLFIKALKELGLPSTEQEFNKMGLRSLGEINNDLLNAKMVLHSNSSMTDINKTPATLRAIKNNLQTFAAELGYSSWEDMEKKYSPNSMMGMIAAFVSMKAGQSAIGSAVNNTTVYAILSRFGLSKRDNPENPVPPVIINGVEIGYISNQTFTAEDGMRIMDLLSTYTSSMTDNTKYGYNSKLNLDIETLSVASLISMNRGKMYDAVRLINAEYIVKYIQDSRAYAIQSEQEELRKQDVGGELKNEILKKLLKAYDNTITNEELVELGKLPVTEEDLKISNVHNPRRVELESKSLEELEAYYETELESTEYQKYLLAQLRILNAYLTISQKHGPEFIAFSQIVKLTKGISSSTKETSFKGDEDLRTYLKQLNLKLVATSKGWQVDYADAKPADLPLYDFKDIVNQHLLTIENLSVFADKTEAQKSYFISQTKLAEDTRALVNKSLRVRMKNKLRTKIMTQFRRDFESFLMLKAWRNTLPENERENLNNYLFTDIGEKNGVSSLVDLKKELIANFPELENNIIFSQVFFKKDQDVFNKVETNTRSKGDQGFEKRLIGEMRRLANTEAWPLVNATIKHLIAKNGLQFKNESPISLISPNILESEYGFSELMSGYTSALNREDDAEFKQWFGASRKELMSEFEELFIRDINNAKYLTRLRGDLLDKTPQEGIQNTITKSGNTFTIDLDKGIKNEKNVAIYDSSGNVIEILDSTSSDQKQRANNFATFKSFKFIKKSKKTKIKDEEKNVVVFEFPKFIKIGNKLYRLKEYVTEGENRFKTDASRFSTEPNKDGEYLGIAATYENIPHFGWFGSSPIGRTIEEAQERTFEDIIEMRNKAKEGAKQIADNIEDLEDMNDYENQAINNIPETPIQLISAVETTMVKPVPAQESKQDQLVQKNMQDMALISVTTDDASRASKDMLANTLIKMGQENLKKLAPQIVFKSPGLKPPELFKNLGKRNIFDAAINPAEYQRIIKEEVDKASAEDVTKFQNLIC